MKVDSISDWQNNLHSAGIHDELTQSYNRTFYQEMLDELIATTLSLGTPLNAILININQFAKINNFYCQDK